MTVSEAQLRALVRETIERQRGSRSHTDEADAGCRTHASHGVLALARAPDAGEACVIEPAVRCNHCGYCQSYGH
jgi:hypothetical protein